jgi:hypothetical protein
MAGYSLVALHLGVAAGISVPADDVALPSPFLAVSLEGGSLHARLWVDFWSAPTALHFVSEDTAFAPLLMAAGGPQFGDQRFRAGPFVTVGLIDAAAGLRGVVQPWTNAHGRQTGFEWRLQAHPGEAFITLYATVAYSVDVASRPRKTVPDPRGNEIELP